MDWIEHNLDAYRVIAEILTDLRPLVRERVEAKHGKEWFRNGIPEDVFERLIHNKEQEASIDWYENRYQEVISYAVFPDLFEIIIANADLFGPILKLAPSQSLLNTRFLELEVMRCKIGRARQISEAEINFLTSFHLRFRRAVQALKGTDGGASGPAWIDGSTGAERSEPQPSDEASSSPAEPVTASENPTNDIADDETRVSRNHQAAGRPPMRLASPTKVAEADGPQEATVEATHEIEDPAEAAEGTSAEPAQRESVATIINRAMEDGEDAVVLREVYREVTGIAEVIWTTEEIPTTAIWDRVSTNTWYESNFSRLELRPLSDFYELISQVRNKRKSGAAKAEIQSFLNDSKFATILLALRDMFQMNGI